MKRKAVALMLALAMTTFSLAACGGKETEETSAPKEETEKKEESEEGKEEEQNAEVPEDLRLRKSRSTADSLRVL